MQQPETPLSPSQLTEDTSQKATPANLHDLSVYAALSWLMVACGSVVLILTLRLTSWQEVAVTPRLTAVAGMGFSLSSLGIVGLSGCLETVQLCLTALVVAAFVGMEAFYADVSLWRNTILAFSSSCLIFSWVLPWILEPSPPAVAEALKMAADQQLASCMPPVSQLVANPAVTSVTVTPVNQLACAQENDGSQLQVAMGAGLGVLQVDGTSIQASASQAKAGIGIASGSGMLQLVETSTQGNQKPLMSVLHQNGTQSQPTVVSLVDQQSGGTFAAQRAADASVFAADPSQPATLPVTPLEQPPNIATMVQVGSEAGGVSQAGPSLCFRGRTFAVPNRQGTSPRPEADAEALHALLNVIEQGSHVRD